MSTQQGSDAYKLPAAMQRLTGLARPVDPTIPSNLLAFIGSALAVLVYALVQLADGHPTGDALSEAVLFGAGVFLAWAITREIDPDHQQSGIWTMPIAVVAMLLMGIPSVLALLGILMGTRVLVQSTGLPITYPDALLLAGVAGAAAYVSQAWLIGVGLLAALLVRSFLSKENPLPLYVGAGLVGVGTVAGVALLDDFDYRWALEALPLLVAGLALVLFALVAVRMPQELISMTDADDRPLTWQFLVAAQGFAFCAGVAFLAYEGANGVDDVSTLYGSLVAVALYNARAALRRAS